MVMVINERKEKELGRDKHNHSPFTFIRSLSSLPPPNLEIVHVNQDDTVRIVSIQEWG